MLEDPGVQPRSVRHCENPRLGRGRCVALCSALLVTVVATPAEAQEFQGIDQLAIRAPVAPSRLDSVRIGAAPAPLEVTGGVRASFLYEPIGGRLPSPGRSGTEVAPVQGSFSTEWTAAVGLGYGTLLGVGIPIVLYQWGSALASAGIGGNLAPVAFGDPRLSASFTQPIGDFSFSPHVEVYFPLGDASSFTGEENVRGDVGLSAWFERRKWLVALDVGTRLRRPSTVGMTTFGPQLLVTLGAAYEVLRNLSVNAELALSPVLAAQPTPTLAEPGFLFPAEILVGADLEVGRFQLGAHGGTGLPLSRPSTDSPGAGLSRGPTSPTLHIGFDATTVF